MMVEGYEILADDDINALNRQIAHWRGLGYEPHGYPFAGNGMVYQAMIKIKSSYAELDGAMIVKEPANG
jgi:hypothetical protein